MASKLWQIFATERVEPNVFSIELTAKGLDNADSLNANVRQLQELLAELQRQEQTINQKYEQILQAKENESKTIELLSIIVAVLVAVAGFYGFKTMADIEVKAEKIAKTKVAEDLPELARTNIKRLARSELERLLKRQGLDAIKTGIKKELVGEFISDIESRIAALENSTVVEDENPVEEQEEKVVEVRSQSDEQEIEDMLANPSLVNGKKEI